MDTALSKIENDVNSILKTIETMGSSRELSLAKTKAEECLMWAKRDYEQKST